MAPAIGAHARTRRVAARPGIGERDRCRTGPRAVGSDEGLALGRGARDGRRGGVLGSRAGDDHGGRPPRANRRADGVGRR